MMTVVGVGTKRDSAVAAVEPQEIDALMRRYFSPDPIHRSANSTSADALAPSRETAPRRDFEMASELLDRASQAFDLLIDRCRRLEHELGDAQEQARTQAAEHADTVEQWKRLATGLKAQLESAGQALEASKARVDAAEIRAGLAEERAAALEHASAQAASHAAMAESLSTKLHDKVISAFGIGSRAHPVLEAVATRAAAE